LDRLEGLPHYGVVWVLHFLLGVIFIDCLIELMWFEVHFDFEDGDRFENPDFENGLIIFSPCFVEPQSILVCLQSVDLFYSLRKWDSSNLFSLLI
jgi:hypothetical protein